MSRLAGVTVGVDVGGTKMFAVRLGSAGELVAERKVPTPAAADFVDALAGVVTDLAAAPTELAGAATDLPRLAPPHPGAGPRTEGGGRNGAGAVGAVGLGVPGMVDSAGELRSSPHLPDLVGLPLARDLAARFPAARVWVGNDATCAGWAEHRLGAAVGVDDLLMVTLGTGIGGGIVAGGRLLEGAHRYAGEVGHTVIDPNGPPCPCGQRGCWERMASGSGLGRLAREWSTAGRAPGVVALAGGDPEAVRGEHVTAAAASGDGDAIELMGELAWWLALGLANLTNVLDPGLVVVGGGLAEAGEVLMAPARDAFARLVEGHRHRRGLTLVAAALGERAGAVGAGLLAAAIGSTRGG